MFIPARWLHLANISRRHTSINSGGHVKLESQGRVSARSISNSHIAIFMKTKWGETYF